PYSSTLPHCYNPQAKTGLTYLIHQQLELRNSSEQLTFCAYLNLSPWRSRRHLSSEQQKPQESGGCGTMAAFLRIHLLGLCLCSNLTSPEIFLNSSSSNVGDTIWVRCKIPSTCLFTRVIFFANGVQMSSQKKEDNKFAYNFIYKVLPSSTRQLSCMYQYKNEDNEVINSSLSDAKNLHISDPPKDKGPLNNTTPPGFGSAAVFILLFAAICCVLKKKEDQVFDDNDPFAIIPPKNPVIGFLGQDVILPCHLKTSSIPEGTSVTLEWVLAQSSETIEVKSYYEGRQPESQDRRYEGRTEVFYNEIHKGNMSLKLKKSQDFDQGKYTCMIQLGEWYDEVIVELKLTVTENKLWCIWFCAANGAEPTIALELYQDWGIGLTCSSQGWYPTPPVLWLNSEGENRTEKAESTNTEQEPIGPSRVSSSMTIQPGGDNGVSCRIINTVLQVESESRIQISGE
ncbi:hypothetical protein lerEdw1_010230, partial [Lerista edwardsae]